MCSHHPLTSVLLPQLPIVSLTLSHCFFPVRTVLYSTSWSHGPHEACTGRNGCLAGGQLHWSVSQGSLVSQSEFYSHYRGSESGTQKCNLHGKGGPATCHQATAMAKHRTQKHTHSQKIDLHLFEKEAERVKREREHPIHPVIPQMSRLKPGARSNCRSPMWVTRTHTIRKLELGAGAMSLAQYPQVRHRYPNLVFKPLVQTPTRPQKIL